MKTFLFMLAIGTSVALALFGFSYWASMHERLELSYALYWQGWVLQTLVPCNDVGFGGIQQCEVTRWHIIAFYAGLPLGAAVYGWLAYCVLVLVRRLRNKSQASASA